ncbi:MAG: ABC transporter ATP-binding protein/permease [Actinobacteria bacterium]|nr:ABC transporter ATP-binding protein/permease [Actinomycetota bacterium]
MVRLAKYLKPFIPMILIAVVLLFVQALSDLTLPDYMSNIINNGIQQGGIVNSVPEAIRLNEMKKITLFMNENDKEEVLKNYTLIDNASSDYDKYLKKYPQLEKEAILVLNKTDKKEIAKINPLMGKAFLAVSGIEQIIEDPAKAAAAGSSLGFDLSKLPSGITSDQIFIMLAQMPAGNLSKIQTAMNEKFNVLGDKMITQMAVGSVKAEYSALGMDVNKLQSNYIWKIGILMLLLSLLSAASTIGVGYFSAMTAAGLAKNLRKKVFDKVSSFSNTEFDKFSTASLITRSTNDITQIQMLAIILIRVVCYAPIMGIGGTIRALGKSTSMSWIIAVAVIILIGIILIVFSISLPKFRIIQSLIDRLNLVTRENLSGMLVIRSFNTQKFEENRFDKANIDLTKTTLFVNRIMVVMMPAMMLIMNGLTLLIIWVGAHQVEKAAMQVGDIMAFMQYAMLIVISFLMLSIMFIMVPRASVSAVRVADVLETETLINDPQNPKQFGSDSHGLIEFKNVSFRYPGAEEDVLHDINFTAKPGKSTAIIGATGAGKSTLVNLIPRFYDVTEGGVFIDGVDIREIKQHDLRDKIGYVPQKSLLFTGTIESNLRYADENASDEQLKTAAEVAQALDFINEKPEGFESRISQAGSNVSGGQNQRLSIARALVKNPDIYIFDDCFSALDFKTDAELRKAIKSHAGKSTMLLIAQRVGTVMKADQIIVLDHGRIVGKGTHTELMASCETYREIALSQFSKEELA